MTVLKTYLKRVHKCEQPEVQTVADGLYVAHFSTNDNTYNKVTEGL